jgi:ABC-type multidrug transport system fused ATPase/permease subunit
VTVSAISPLFGPLRLGVHGPWGQLPAGRTLAALGLAALARAIGQAGLATNGGILASKLVPGSSRMEQSLVVLALLSVAAIAVKTLASAALAHIGKRVTGKMGANLRAAVLRGMLHGEAEAVPDMPQPLRRSRQQDHGLHDQAKRLGALTDHLREAEDALQSGTLRWIASFLEVLALAVALLAISVRLSLFAACFFVLLALPITLLRKRMRRALEKSSAEQHAVRERVHETVHALDLLRVSGAGPKTAARLEALGHALTRSQAWIAMRAALLSGANELAAALALVLMLAAFQGHADMLRFFITMVLCYKPLRDLSDARSAIQHGEVAMDALRPYLKESVAVANRTHAWTTATLRVERLETATGFWNLELAPGTKLVLRGPTGSGKTTLLRTLLGLTPQRSGTLRYGGITLDDERTHCLPNARPFAWLPQETPVLIGTLRDNIRPQDDAPISKAAALAPLLVGISEPTRGMDTNLDARMLSGGERQLLGIARVLEGDAPVLLLDEPTAALDQATKRRVLEVLAAEPRSIIIATHDADVEQIATHRAVCSDDGTMSSVPLVAITIGRARAS